MAFARGETGVQVGEDMYDGVLSVLFVRLTPSGELDRTRPDIGLPDLVIQRHPADYEGFADYERSVVQVKDLDVDELRTVFKDQAMLLRAYGADLLVGDWSIEPEVRAWHQARGGP